MLRKACLVALGLALAAFVPSEASVADEIRELHSSNKTKHSHKDTSRSRNKRAKEVTLCLGGDYSLTRDPTTNYLYLELGGNNRIHNLNAQVFDCDDIEVANPEALGELAYTCSWIESAPTDSSTVAVCYGLLNLNTEWHKKPNSVAAFSFLVDTAAFETSDLTQLTPLASVVTGTTGNWAQPENFADFYIDVVADPFSGMNNYPFEITIVYKQRGWNPEA